MPKLVATEEQVLKAEATAARIHALANWVAAHPCAPEIRAVPRGYIYCRIYTESKEELADYLRGMGPCLKRPSDPNSDDFEFSVFVADDLQIRFYVGRELVCERKVVGKRLVPEEYVPGRLVEAHEEEIVEWVCNEPILKPHVENF